MTRRRVPRICWTFELEATLARVFNEEEGNLPAVARRLDLPLSRVAQKAKALGLRKNTPTCHRRCLGPDCGKTFLSSHAGERLCPSCRRLPVYSSVL